MRELQIVFVVKSLAWIFFKFDIDIRWIAQRTTWLHLDCVLLDNGWLSEGGDAIVYSRTVSGFRSSGFDNESSSLVLDIIWEAQRE